MIQGRGGISLLFKTKQSILVETEFSRKKLESDVASQTRVPRKINFTHAARAQEGANFITT